MCRWMVLSLGLVFALSLHAQTSNNELDNYNRDGITDGGKACKSFYSPVPCHVPVKLHTVPPGPPGGPGWPAADLNANGPNPPKNPTGDPLYPCIADWLTKCLGPTTPKGQPIYDLPTYSYEDDTHSYKYQDMYCQNAGNPRPTWVTKCYLGDTHKVFMPNIVIAPPTN
jgi:hypothetical protein